MTKKIILLSFGFIFSIGVYASPLLKGDNYSVRSWKNISATGYLYASPLLIDGDGFVVAQECCPRDGRCPGLPACPK